jgi:hypothetical protein
VENREDIIALAIKKLIPKKQCTIVQAMQLNRFSL